ncbi:MULTISPECIES: ABC transporter permease [Rhizobium]|uniref:Transport permease protein n=1 Tax=Rhizobium laguerreae TaxID=1076926 RepID=A0A7Y2RBI0_9HYPH|nr:MULTISPECIES: ABC transporter permease [Rhizobium]NNH67570.1 ABC transporter permease [Rhizobium laguerreae]UWU28825.1 ABC transporter permease [Rhizobium leguminosarum bv. viciae]
MSNNEIIIRPPKLLAQFSVRELWECRSLIYSMISRQLKSEFDQQYLAFVWPVFRPVLMVVLFTLFRHLSDAKTGVSIPYPLYVYSGLVLWFMFTEAVMQTAGSIRREADIVKKIYFPKVIVPISDIISNVVIFSLNVVPLVLMMLYYGGFPGLKILLLPVFILQFASLIFGLGCLFAALGLQSNDWERFLGFALYVGLFVSPVIYAPGMIPADFQTLYALNPMVGTLGAFRACLFADWPFPLYDWTIAAMVSFAVGLVGFIAFQHMERHFVDRL